MKRSLITLVAVLAACVNPTASAVNWVVDANGNWTTDANWDAANPSGAGAVADFSTLDISADHTVTLDANRTVGTLRLGDTGGTVYSWTLSGANALTLQASSGSATLAVNQGTANLIAVPVTLNDPVTATVAATARLEISGNITGVAKDMWLPANFGTLRLSGNNSGWSGMLRMNGSNLGTIEVTNNNSLGTLNLNPYSYGGGPLRINNVSGGALTLPVGWTPYNDGGHTVNFGGGDMTFTGTWYNRDCGVTLAADAGVTVTMTGAAAIAPNTGGGSNSYSGPGTFVLAGDASRRTAASYLNSGVRVGIAVDDAFGPSSVTLYTYNGGVEIFAVGGARSLASQFPLSGHAYSSYANRYTFSGSNDLTFTGNMGFWQTNGDTRLNVTSTGLVTLAGNLTGTLDAGRSVIKEGAGTLVMTGSNSAYTRNLQIDAGVLRAQDGTGLSPNCTLIFNGGVLEANGTVNRTLGTAGGQMRWAGNGGFSAFGGALTVDVNGDGADNLTWGSTAGFVPNNSTLIFGSTRADNAVTFVDNIALGDANRTIAVADNALSEFDKAVLSGQITGAGGLIKTGLGVLELDGDNTYSGDTLVSAGTLLVDGTTDNQRDYTITAGATLGGEGAIGLAPEVGVDVSGTVSPGASIGTLTAGTAGNSNTVTFADGSALLIEMNALGNCDRLVVNGTLDLEADGDTLILTGEFSKGVLYTLATADTILGQFNNVNSSALGRTLPVTYGPNSITIFIPEPTTLALAGGTLAALLMRRRR